MKSVQNKLSSYFSAGKNEIWMHSSNFLTKLDAFIKLKCV